MATVSKASVATDFAADHFEREGYAIIAKKAETKFGPIDLIAHQGNTIVFVTLGNKPMNARDTRDFRKRAASWLTVANDRPSAVDVRFDRVNVVLDTNNRLLSIDHTVGVI